MKYSEDDPDLDLTVLRYNDPLLTGVVLDWALAAATKDTPIFNMHDGTYPGNNAKLLHCMEKPAVIVDLEWKLWHEGPDSRINGRWEPTRNWAQLGPYLAEHVTLLTQRDTHVVAKTCAATEVKAIRIEDAIALTVIRDQLGDKFSVPTKLLEIQKMLTEDNMKYILTS
jgi:hypothetical protein